MTVRTSMLCGAAMILLGITACERGNRFLVPRLLGVEPATVLVDEAPQALVKVAPEYPDIAREAGVDGTVQLQVLVCRNGLISNIVIEPGKSIPMLDAAAGAAVKKWRFKPAHSGGRPVAAWTQVPVKFSLH